MSELLSLTRCCRSLSGHSLFGTPAHQVKTSTLTSHTAPHEPHISSRLVDNDKNHNGRHYEFDNEDNTPVPTPLMMAGSHFQIQSPGPVAL